MIKIHIKKRENINGNFKIIKKLNHDFKNENF